MVIREKQHKTQETIEGSTLRCEIYESVDVNDASGVHSPTQRLSGSRDREWEHHCSESCVGPGLSSRHPDSTLGRDCTHTAPETQLVA